MFLRIYTGADGQSHFEDIDLPPPELEVTSPQGASEISFRRIPPGYVADWHTAPRRQYVINLTGSWEIRVGDGTVRLLGPGDVLLAEDVTGQGHLTTTGDQPRFSATIPLEG